MIVIMTLKYLLIVAVLIPDPIASSHQKYHSVHRRTIFGFRIGASFTDKTPLLNEILERSLELDDIVSHYHPSDIINKMNTTNTSTITSTTPASYLERATITRDIFADFNFIFPNEPARTPLAPEDDSLSMTVRSKNSSNYDINIDSGRQ